MITLITPTRNRPQCFALLEKYMDRQTVRWDQWIVVNDGQEPYSYTLGQTVINRDSRTDYDPAPGKRIRHSVNLNYLAALPQVQGDIVCCVEDDDWYSPTYLETKLEHLNEVELAGLLPVHYFNFMHTEHRTTDGLIHCNLSATGFRASVLGDFEKWCLHGDPFIDMNLWESYGGTKRNFRNLTRDGRPLMVGLKGLWGEVGVGAGHSARMGRHDDDWRIIRSWIGDDLENYI